MATTFDDVYNQAKQELYEKQATLARDRLGSIPTKDLPAELQRAEQTINMHHEKEETDDIVRLLLPHMRTCAIQEVAIIKEVMALRAKLLTERAEQLRQVIATSTEELALCSEHYETLRPYLLGEQETSA